MQLYKSEIDVWKYSITFLLKCSPIWMEVHDSFLSVDSGCKAAWAANQGEVSFQTLKGGNDYWNLLDIYCHWVITERSWGAESKLGKNVRFSTAMLQELGSSYREERNAMTAEDPIFEACWNIWNILNASTTCVHSMSRASGQSKDVSTILIYSIRAWDGSRVVLQALHPSNLDVFSYYILILFLFDLSASHFFVTRGPWSANCQKTDHFSHRGAFRILKAKHFSMERGEAGMRTRRQFL